MENKKFLEITDKNGNIVKYEILSAFLNADTEKNYIIYTDNTKDEQENLNIYASIYYPNDNSKLDKIETDEEWELIENFLETLKQE